MVTKLPEDIIKVINTAGMNKAKMRIEKTLVMGFLAGAFIAFGGLLAIMVGGGLPGIKMTNPGFQKLVFGGTFPVGLMLVVIAGSELFTGNTAISVPGVLSGRIKCFAWVKNMFLSYTGNLIGSLFGAFFL
ncbi:MAG: formate/nitrite transporter family protein, partial [Desulfobacteraceae bacterium]|nr:formate/nitrite transporter family protein [Desulfobacteraceae bacterium]